MTHRPAPLALVLLVSLCAAPLAAQPAHVYGAVTDAETGAPLPGAHVFADGTVRGDAAGAGGRFAFDVSPGPARVTATMLGYGTVQVDRLLWPGDTLRVAFQLVPDVVRFDAVEVVGRRDDAWHRALDVFRPVFLGVTANAERTALVNPEVVDLDHEPRRSLDAVARAPLVVRNGALGYAFTFYDLRVRAADGTRSWAGAVSYRDLCDGPCPAAVAAARERAYRGSPVHFLRSLVRDRLASDGFEARLVSGPGRHSRSLADALGGLFGGRGGAVEPRPAPHGWTVEADGAIRVEYDRERDRRSNGPQVSWLVARDGVLRLGPDGALLDPDSVVAYGYWNWERAADAVPLDYRPAPPGEG